MCTAPITDDAVFGDILRPRNDAKVTITKVSLRGADNLKAVEVRTAPVSLGGTMRSLFATNIWPMDTGGRWRWSRATPGPHAEDVLAMVHVTRPDPSRPGSAAGIEFTYTFGDRTATLDNGEGILISNPCP